MANEIEFSKLTSNPYEMVRNLHLMGPCLSAVSPELIQFHPLEAKIVYPILSEGLNFATTQIHVKMLLDQRQTRLDRPTVLVGRYHLLFSFQLRIGFLIIIQ